MKKKAQSNLKRALAKAHQFSDTKQWCGCFTPSEIAALLEAGATPASPNEFGVKYAQEKKSQGIANPTWFYFYPNGLKVREQHSNKRHGEKT